MEAWIGAGGWGYFHGPSGRPLADYARAFGFVEVNTTFYRHPTILDARRWRRSVPREFRFAVKGHRSITHVERFLATRKALAALSRDAAIARALDSDILVLETPPDLAFHREHVLALREFGEAVGSRIRIAIEPRAYSGKALPAALASSLRDLGGIDVVDLSRGDRPRVGSEVAYARLLGSGKHNVWEYSDEELRQIDAASRSQGSDRMVFAFHGVRMYKDAARFLSLERTGTLPPATKRRGLEAIQEVLEPDAKFPATKAALLRDHGWKVVAIAGKGNVHARELLDDLPQRRFGSVGEVVSSLRS